MKIMELLSKKPAKSKDPRREIFEKRCTELTERLQEIRSAFNSVSDEQAIEAMIYEENAVICLLELLYREARAEGITLQVHERRKNQG
ncbi:MAG: hypothetical protein J1F09_03630 [Oscillospiraceae bacterium]|nr:hypothetical protein [Oscillospiraceae bacterium]